MERTEKREIGVSSPSYSSHFWNYFNVSHIQRNDDWGGGVQRVEEE